MRAPPDSTVTRTSTATNNVVQVDFRARRGWTAPGPSACSCGATGRRHSKACPATRTDPADRYVAHCPWAVCRGRGYAGRDCGPCQGPDWMPQKSGPVR